MKEGEADKWYELGILTGTKNVAGRLGVMSAEAFGKRQDKEAYLLRKLADEFAEEARKLRETYDAKYPNRTVAKSKKGTT